MANENTADAQNLDTKNPGWVARHKDALQVVASLIVLFSIPTTSYIFILSSMNEMKLEAKDARHEARQNTEAFRSETQQTFFELKDILRSEFARIDDRFSSLESTMRVEFVRVNGNIAVIGERQSGLEAQVRELRDAVSTERKERREDIQQLRGGQTQGAGPTPRR